MRTKRHGLLLLVLPVAAITMSACLTPGGYSVSEWDPSMNPGDINTGSGGTGGSGDGSTGGGGGGNLLVALPYNVVPLTSLDGLNVYSVGESSSVARTFSFTISDPDPETFSYAPGYPSCGTAGSIVGTPVLSGGGGSFECVFSDGPAASVVAVAVQDNEGVSLVASHTVDVHNVAPTVTMSPLNPSSATEGSTHTIVYTVSDPGTDDVTAVSTDCGAAGSKVPSSDVFTNLAGSFACVFPDGPNTTTLSAAVTDSDNATGAAGTQSVHVDNVAPSVTAAGNQSSNEGNSHSFDLGSFVDPGDDADWSVSVDWGDGSTPSSATQGATGTLTAASHAYADDTGGPFTATVTVTDPDGASTSGTFNVAVSNVAPTITGFSATDAIVGVMVEASSSITATWTDPGADTFDGNYVFDDGIPNPNFRVGITSADTFTHTFASPGCDKPVTVEIRDDDGGTDSESATVSVGSAEFLAPLSNTQVIDTLNNGQVLPVKIQVLDCSGSPITGLAPTIELVAGDQTTVAESGSVTVPAFSVSSADTDGVMRSSGDHYMYNLRVDLPLNTEYTIVIHPYGAGSSGTLGHVILAN